LKWGAIMYFMNQYFKIVLFTLVFYIIPFPLFAFTYEIHGDMKQAIGFTSNADVFSLKLNSAETDYFQYKTHLNQVVQNDFTPLNFMNSPKSNDVTFGATRGILWIKGKTDDNKASLVYGAEVQGYNWGDNEQDFGLAGEGLTQETYLLYADVKAPWAQSADNFFRIGLQHVDISDWVWNETAAGLTFHGKNGMSQWMLGWFRGENDKYTNASDNNYFVAHFQRPLEGDNHLEFFCIYEHTGEEATPEFLKDPNDLTIRHYRLYSSDTYYLGVNSQFTFGSMFGTIDIIYQGGNINFIQDKYFDDIPGLERSANLIHLTGGIQVTDKFKLYGTILSISGDMNESDLDVDNFKSIDVKGKVGQIFFKDSIIGDIDHHGADAPYFQDKGLIQFALTGEYQYRPNHHFKFALRHLMTQVDLPVRGPEETKDNDIGTEIDFWYHYSLNQYATLVFESAYLYPRNGGDMMTDYPCDAKKLFQMISGVEISF